VRPQNTVKQEEACYAGDRIPSSSTSDTKAIAGEKQTNWRRIHVRLRAAATRQESLYVRCGRVAATSMPDKKTSQVVYFSTEIAL
jgi:hypothetical protein